MIATAGKGRKMTHHDRARPELLTLTRAHRLWAGLPRGPGWRSSWAKILISMQVGVNGEIL